MLKRLDIFSPGVTSELKGLTDCHMLSVELVYFYLFQGSDERKPLLPHPNPVSKPPSGADWINTSVPSARTDEQALLTSILTKTAQ